MGVKQPQHRLVQTETSTTVDGHTRTFSSVAPRDLPNGAPLMIVFHGSYQTGQTVRKFAGGAFDDLAAREKLVVAYPDAYKRLWNDARLSSSYPARVEGYDDVKFTRALISHFARTAGINPNRVYVVGYSNGAQFVNRLVHEMGDELAGAVLIAATQPEAKNFPTDMPLTALPVVLVHGTQDPLVPYDGGMASLWGFRPRGIGLSHYETAEYLAARNGIATKPTVWHLPSPRSKKTSITVRDWAQPGRPPVRAFTVEGGGHVIPNPTRSASRIYGRTNTDLNIAQASWDFFVDNERSTAQSTRTRHAQPSPSGSNG